MQKSQLAIEFSSDDYSSWVDVYNADPPGNNGTFAAEIDTEGEIACYKKGLWEGFKS